jgi:MFS family permease
MTHRQKNRALLLLAVTQFMLVIDASVNNVALPTIGHDLHINQGVAILVSVSTSQIADFGRAAGTHHALVAGYSRAFLVGTAFALLGALLSAVLISSRDS